MNFVDMLMVFIVMYMSFGVLTVHQCYFNDHLFNRHFIDEDIEGKLWLIFLGIVIWPIIVIFYNK